jgi:Xaa-Pro aminopeptidase
VVPPSLLRRYSQVYPVGSAGARFPEVLKARRRAHLDELRARGSFAIFAGVPREPGSENIWVMSALKIFQEPAVIHLTGINQPNIILALVPGIPGKFSDEEVLFLPEKNPEREFWDGVRFGIPSTRQTKSGAKTGKTGEVWGAGSAAGGVKGGDLRALKTVSSDLQDIRTLTGIHDVRALGEFEEWFEALVKKWKQPRGQVFWHRYVDDKGKVQETRTDHNFAFKQRLEKLAKTARTGFKLETCAPQHYRLRLPLDRGQIKDVDKAVEATRAAFVETLAEVRSLRTETELEARLQYGMLRRSPYGLAFPSIIAGGRNATVLHYLKNDEPLPKDGLVLMDFGARWGTMHADITRVFPMNGRFNLLQALIYGIVLDAAKENQRNAKPGATIRDLNDKVWAFLENALQERFFSKGGKAERAYTGKPHGVSHLMGEQEHDGDPHRIYQDHPLQPGWQISNEPGLYGHFTITINGKRYSEWIGIRIEDDLLITKTGCRNMSASIPKEIQEIERLLSGH